MKYIKSQKLFEALNAWGEEEVINNNPMSPGNVRNNIQDILIDLEHKGFEIEYDFRGLVQPPEFVSVYSKFNILISYDTDYSFNFNDIKYPIEHLISYLDENKYRLSFIETSLISGIGKKFNGDSGERIRGTNIEELNEKPTATLADYIRFYFRHGESLIWRD